MLAALKALYEWRELVSPQIHLMQCWESCRPDLLLARQQKRHWTSLESRGAPGIAISLTLRSLLLQLLRVFLFLRRSGGDFLLCLPGVVGFAHDGLPLCITLTEDDATPVATQACVDSKIS